MNTARRSRERLRSLFSDLTESGAACLKLVRQISPSLPQAQFLSLSVILPVPVDALLADGAGVLLDQFRSGKDHLHALGSYLPC